VLVGRTLKELGFRARYQGAVIAIHRSGERIHAKLGTVTLRAGDTLLFIADPSFRRSDFLIVTRIGVHLSQWRQRRGRWVGLLFIGVVVSASSGMVSLLEATFLAATIVIASRVLTATEAREAIDLEVIFVVAGSFAIGAAVQESGLGDQLGALLVTMCEPFGPRGALLAITLVTIALAQVLTCNAAAAVGFPLAIAVAHRLGLDPRAFAIAVAVAASSSYLTPLVYQTKMMVFGPGGYRFGDYFRLGAPLTLAVIVVIVVVVPLFWPL
jgi:di/tricarboxylate transporter